MPITASQERLILNTIMAGFANNLVSADLVEWNVHENEMNDRNGLVVAERAGPQYFVTEAAGGPPDLSGGVQSSVIGSQTFNINRTFTTSMGASDLESITSFGAAMRSTALNNAIARLASKIDIHIMDIAAKAFPHSVGTYGTALTDPAHFALARTRLAELGIESDQNLTGVITHTDKYGLAKYIYNDNAALSAEGSRAMRQGFSGMLDGLPVKATNQLGSITTGSRTNGTVAGASQNVNYRDVANAGANAGYYLSQNFLVAGLGALGTVKKGEVFTITSGAAVESWDVDANRSRGFNQQFVVLIDATAVTSGAATLRIYPAIIVGDGTTKTSTGGENNAHRTVTAAPANGATVTWLGTASTLYKPRMIWRKDAIVVNTAPLRLPDTGQGFRRSLASAQRDSERNGPTPPLMPRVWMNSTFDTGVHNVRIDVFAEAMVRERWAGIKFFGS